MKKAKWIIILLAFSLLLAGCNRKEEASGKAPERYQATYLSLFDTVTTLVGYAESEEAFNAEAKQIHDEMLTYHRLYDIYNEYDGLVNLKVINEKAPYGPVRTDRKVIDLILFAKEIYEATDHRVNIALGSVLSLWHEAREDGIYDPLHAYLPDMDALREAALHTDLDKVVVDEKDLTVFFEDPEIRLDVGAIAKGYATQRVMENTSLSMLISVGGNVAATQPKPDGSSWIVGLQDPDGSDGSYKNKVSLTTGAVVTSGDYQRYYVVDDVEYHHIIDPETLMPGRYWRAVSVITSDSGVADALSTALFLMDREDGQKLLDRYGAYALWTAVDGTEYQSEGYENVRR